MSAPGVCVFRLAASDFFFQVVDTVSRFVLICPSFQFSRTDGVKRQFRLHGLILAANAVLKGVNRGGNIFRAPTITSAELQRLRQLPAFAQPGDSPSVNSKQSFQVLNSQ
jgi:hypothetical protein